MIDISIVIATFNGEEYLEGLCKELKAVLGRLNKSYEILIVNDASSDGSRGILGSIAAQDPRIKNITLDRNMGQYAALSIGIKQSAGDIVITMDDDLQNRPADIPFLLDVLSKGGDIACGWRKGRKESFLFRLVPSYLFNLLISLLIGKRLHDFGCSFKAFRRKVVEDMKSFDRIIDFIPNFRNYRLKEIRVGTAPETKTRYPNPRLARNALVIIGLCIQSRLAQFNRAV